MKSSTLLATAVVAALSMPAVALADDAHHPEKANAPVAAQAKTPAPEQTVQKMQGNVKKMQAQLDRLGKTRNEAEFQKLMAEHMQTMRENMMLGQSMAGMGCPMMEGGMGHGMMGGGMMADHQAMQQRMQAMEQRMDMMERRAQPASPR